ncbi:MAG: hypothetical protein U0572_02670 [Phycisphaerales bacterium]
MATAQECIESTLKALNALRIAHMITGSLASNVYGLPRMSKDADIVVSIEHRQLADLAASVRPALRLDAQQAFEGVTGTTRWSLVADGGAFEVELFELGDDAHDRARFARRRPIELYGIPTFIPTAEDVVVQKLRWAARGKRDKDIDDALNVLFVSGDALDWPYVRDWCDAHGSRELLESLRQRAGLDR